MIEVRNLSRLSGKQDGKHALIGLNFTVEKGQVWGILGAEQSGKTTAVDLITGCLTDGEGQILIDGADMAADPETAKEHLGYMPHAAPMYGEMSVRRFLKFVADARGMSSRLASERIDEAIRKAELKDVAETRICELSEGIRRFVALAQALVGAPGVLVLDEPTDGLNPKEIVTMRRIIASLKQEYAIVLASDIVNEVCMLCDRVTVLSGGKAVAEGVPSELAKLHARSDEWILTMKGAEDAIRAALKGVKGVKLVSLEAAQPGAFTAALTLEQGEQTREALFWAASKAGCPILEMTCRMIDMDEILNTLSGESFGMDNEGGSRQ